MANLIPLKWKQLFYPFIMLFGSKKVVSGKTPNMQNDSIYNIPLVSIDGKPATLEKYAGKKMLIVNVASECGFTPQYAQLQELYENYHDVLEVLAFPSNDFGAQEPGSNEQIKNFCTENYYVSFPLFSKISVKGENKHPLYRWLSDAGRNGWNDKEPEWNFSKYLVNEKGELLNYFSQTVSPLDDVILRQLNRNG